METYKNELLKAFNNTMNVQLLKYAAGLHCFCPNCSRILDFKTVVILDVWNLDKTQYAGQKIGCTNCFKPEGIPKLKEKGILIEVTQYVETHI